MEKLKTRSHMLEVIVVRRQSSSWLVDEVDDKWISSKVAMKGAYHTSHHGKRDLGAPESWEVQMDTVIDESDRGVLPMKSCANHASHCLTVSCDASLNIFSHNKSRLNRACATNWRFFTLRCPWMRNHSTGVWIGIDIGGGPCSLVYAGPWLGQLNDIGFTSHQLEKKFSNGQGKDQAGWYTT